MSHDDPMPDPTAMLSRLAARLGDLERLRREVAGLWRDLHAFGGPLPVSGYAPDEWLTLVGRLSGFDSRRLQTVATRLPALPSTDRALWNGTVTVDQAGWIIDATRRLSGHLLAEADVAAVALAQDVNRRGDDPDIRGDLDRLVRDLRPETSIQRMERRREQGQRCVGQQDLDGGGWLYAELDQTGFPTTWHAIEHAAGPPSPELPRARQRAAGLVAVASHWLASPVHGRARPAVTVHVELADASVNTAGVVLRTGHAGGPGLLSQRAVEVIACDADLLVQLTDGVSPLARLEDLTTLPETVRRAVLDRDGGCRWAGCVVPVWQCDVHHLIPRADGGSHNPDNLVALCRRHHRRLHGPHWDARLDPTTGRLALHHRGARRPTHTSLPHGRSAQRRTSGDGRRDRARPGTELGPTTGAVRADNDDTTTTATRDGDQPPEVAPPR